MNEFTILHPDRLPQGRIRAAIFDFDGTFSTLRCGWEKVMRKLMLEILSLGPAEQADAALQKEVDEYIDASTGIQTVFQMQWLAEQAEKRGVAVAGRDEWWYKDEYNRRLMDEVRVRLEALESGAADPTQYLISGAVAFVRFLAEHGVDLYLASGTDHKDVVREATALGVKDYFKLIKGAPERQTACSKEAVIRELLAGLPGESLLIVGDGKVEIRLGAENDAFTLGAATDEKALCGVNPVKRTRLVNAGADALTGDFTDLDSLRKWLGM